MAVENAENQDFPAASGTNSARRVVPFVPPQRTWVQKFADAFAGIALGARCQCSFYIHAPAAIAVIALAAALRVDWTEACLLALCITAVISAELMNSALERMAKAITLDFNEDIRVALNIASGAVLVVAIGASVVGAMIFVPRLLALLSSAVAASP